MFSLDRQDAWAAMLAENFREDTGVRIQLQGVEGAMEVFTAQCRGMLRAFARVNGVNTLGDCEGVSLGYFTSDEEQLNQFLLEEQSALLQSVPAETLSAIQQNSAELVKIARPDWYTAVLGAGEVYILQAIAVRKDRRGTGVFRRLLTPTLDEARRRGTPVVLQTFEVDNLRRYEHMGFRLVEEVSAPTGGLTCYNMVFAP